MWQQLAGPLLLGLGLAGLLHALLPPGLVRRRLGARGLGGVIEASLLGVPMPLCSCGVVPTAIGLRRDGASRGAATSFLISTPQTGLDSVLVSAGLLGWPFALFKLGAAFATGLLGGAAVEALDRFRPDAERAPAAEAIEARPDRRARSVLGVSREAARYALFDLLGMIDGWLIFGVLAAALLGLWLPAGSLGDVAWVQGLPGMLLALAISMPLYVCTTSSVPIAASLVSAGLPAGSALVFLMAGPATNLATLGAVYRGLGGRVLAVYLATVAVSSLMLGALFDWVLPGGTAGAALHAHGPGWLSAAAAWLGALLLAWLLLRRAWRRVVALRARARTAGARTAGAQKEGDAMEMEIEVRGMSCAHCVHRVKQALEAVEGVSLAVPDLESGRVRVQGEHLDAGALAAAIERAGYEAGSP
ncbi:MAG: permease [Deltaproteobacteria bacterium]|nr:permease [Deltaproteobacteria bacterium]